MNRMVVSRRKLAVALVLLALPTALAGTALAAPAWASLAPLSREGGASGSATTGSSFVTVDGVCVPAARASCTGTTWGDGEFGVASSVHVRVVATWRSACMGCGEMKVYVPGLASVTGKSPLTLDLGQVGTGTYPVSVFFGGPVVGSARQDVTWTVHYG